MNGDINLKAIKIKPLLTKLWRRYGKHAVFAAVILVLLVYVFVVFRISTMASAEPGPDQQTTVSTVIPKVDLNTIDQIQHLESVNPNIKAQIDQARKNPFQE